MRNKQEPLPADLIAALFLAVPFAPLLAQPTGAAVSRIPSSEARAAGLARFHPRCVRTLVYGGLNTAATPRTMADLESARAGRLQM